MRADLKSKRDSAMQRIWDLQDDGKTDEDPDVTEAARAAIAELQHVLQEAGGSADPSETGTAWKYLGDAWFTLRRTVGRGALVAARDAYLSSESFLMKAGAELPLAKLNFNLANTLRVIDGGYNRADMEAARTRYQRAVQGFQRTNPDAVPVALESLQSLELVIRALGMYEHAEAEKKHGQELLERLEKAGPSEAGVPDSVQGEVAAMQAAVGRDIHELDSFVRQVAPLTSAVSGLEEQLQTLHEGRTVEDHAEFDQIYAMLDQAIASGEVTGERANFFRSMLQQYQNLSSRPAETPEQLAAKAVEMHEHISRFKSLYTTPKPQQMPRAQRIAQLFGGVRAFVFDQVNRASSDSDREFQFMLEAGHASRALADAPGLEAVRQVEHDRVRPLVFGLRQHALTHHLMVVEPFWGWSKVDPDPNAVFFAGSEAIRQQVADLCVERGLTPAERLAAWGVGQARWNQLRGCALAVFDLGSGTPVASVCHALGMALALGVQPMVIAPEAGLPFDIDIRAALPGESLGDALDEALFALPAAEGSGSFADTIRETIARCGAEDASTRVLVKTLSSGKETEKTLALLAALNGGGKWGLIRPFWPAFYPDPGEPRCFHVMPFSEPWSNHTRDVVRAACGDSVRFRRGDETEDPNVIRSIWEEVCRAAYVVVDLTGLNPNVCLELGLAQVVGRPTLLVARSDRNLELFPEIAKLQVRRYDSDESLAALVRKFIVHPH